MNSEELEVSLRTEFESYLKGVLAGMQQDVADFQKNFEAEFEKHRSQMDDAFRSLSERFSSDVKFDKAFTESVVEHLRLARDDGAQLSAEAFAEAQKLEPPAAAGKYDQLRDAINDISGHMTQAAILNSLVDHVSNIAPRGAFFIAKNDEFICWRRFDRGQNASDDSVRDIHFSVSEDTLLADAVRSLSTKDSTSHSGDSVYLDALGFGNPQRMVAVPLTARGRGVAVLYVDSGYDNRELNVEAVESLVRVAGLTVELRAASAAAQTGAVETPSHAPMRSEQEAPAQAEAASPVAEVESAPEYQPEPSSHAVAEPTYETSNFPAYEEPAQQEVSYAPEVAEYTGVVAVEEEGESEPEVSESDDSAYFEPVAVSEVQPEVESSYGEVEMPAPAPAEKVSDFAFTSSSSFDAPAEVQPEVEPVEEYAYAGETKNGTNGHSFEPSPEPVVEVATAQPVKSRLSDRHVDLPIEVSEDERRFHNEARRFARLLVSEIKLYNEQKVNEGRDSSDLYDRLREAIDRSREMYEKRVQPQVASKFDYFHYELVTNLAEGSDTKLGANYPGSSV